MVTSRAAPLFFMLWGIPFVAIGLYMVVGRFFAEARQRARTWYALTPDRIVIVSGLFARSIKSLPLRTLSDITLTETSNGKGTITFGPQSAFSSLFGTTTASWPGSGQRQAPGFDSIDDARAVYERIRSAQRPAA